MWILIGCTLFWLGVGVILYKRRERKIRKLILYLSHIQDRISLPPFESYSEGQLGILQSEIYKVMNLLEEQSRQSKEQNTYLADKSARLAELDVLLNMDGRGRPAPETVIAKSSRPSVLEGLKRPVPPRSPEKKPKHHEQEAR